MPSAHLREDTYERLEELRYPGQSIDGVIRQHLFEADPEEVPA